MPDFPTDVVVVPRVPSNSFTVTLAAAGGDKTTVQLTEYDDSVTGLELAEFRTAIGNLSNAAVIKTTNSQKVTIAESRVNPLDESYSSAGMKMILRFQNAALQIVTMAIPAPDESYFGADGISLIPPLPSAPAGTPARVLANSIAAIANVLNGGVGGTGTFVFLSGYRSDQSRKLVRPRTARPSVEPSPTTEPGPEPS